ncbi:MAG TPA: MarR family transcriptional regulator [Anaerolineaceae bacterium]|nr:MarR family transcriptional regulator [Anaerolineaceae bacterium]
MTVSEANIERFVEILERFIRQRPNILQHDSLAHFKQQMEDLRSCGSSSWEDYHFLFRILIILAHSVSPPTMGELSAELAVPYSTATRIVDWLVQGGVVERIDDPADRRVVRVQLSESGRQVCEENLEHQKVWIAHTLRVFSPEEQEQLLKLMSKLLDTVLN